MILDLDFVIDFNYLEKIFEKYQIKNDAIVMHTELTEQRAYFCEHSQNQDRYLIGFFAYAILEDQTPVTTIPVVAFSLNDSDGVIFPNSRALFQPLARNTFMFPVEHRLNVGGFIDTKKPSIKVNINKVVRAGKTIFVKYFHSLSMCTFFTYILYAEGKLKEGVV